MAAGAWVSCLFADVCECSFTQLAVWQHMPCKWAFACAKWCYFPQLLLLFSGRALPSPSELAQAAMCGSCCHGTCLGLKLGWFPSAPQRYWSDMFKMAQNNTTNSLSLVYMCTWQQGLRHHLFLATICHCCGFFYGNIGWWIVSWFGQRYLSS